MTVLGFDYGTQKIGVATGNSVIGRGSPLCALKARDGVPDWTKIEALINEWKPTIIVVGNPLNMDGTPSELSKRATKFANRIHGRFGAQIAMVDERLTSSEAKSLAKERGHQGDFESDPIDAEAAALIIDSYFRSAKR